MLGIVARRGRCGRKVFDWVQGWKEVEERGGLVANWRVMGGAKACWDAIVRNVFGAGDGGRGEGERWELNESNQ